MKYNLEIDGQTYQVEVEDINARPVVARVDGERFEVWPESAPPSAQAGQAGPEISIPSEPAQPGLKPAAPAAGGNELAAPLPGVIVAVLVQPGDRVSRGQELVTLEAMKMKNAIKSHREGTVDSVAVSVGDQVAHGQTLVTFKD